MLHALFAEDFLGGGWLQLKVWRVQCDVEDICISTAILASPQHVRFVRSQNAVVVNLFS